MEMRRDRKKRPEPAEATGWLLQTNKEKQERRKPHGKEEENKKKKEKGFG
jgi:hypothetical protein